MMNALLAKTANLSLLALAAAPLLAVSLAHAEPVKVTISDLNLARPSDQRILDARIAKAADQYCSIIDHRELARVQDCKDAVRADVLRQLPAPQVQVRASQPANG
jgi:UrcA family protein